MRNIIFLTVLNHVVCEALYTPYWWESGWSECHNALQTQSVECRAQEDQTLLNETECGNQKPLAIRDCYEGVWEYGPFDLCDDEGLRSRNVTCSIVATGDQCDPALKLQGMVSCTPLWNPGEWTQCDIDTGEIQSRTLSCEAEEDGSALAEHLCAPVPRPETNRTCVDICGHPPNIMDVHVVAMYQSACTHSFGNHPITTMYLEISDSVSERTALFLHSYEGIAYKILGAGKNKIWKIVAQGNHPKGIIDAPPHTVIETCSYGSCAPTLYSEASIENDATSYTSVVGAEALASVTAAYELPYYIFIGEGTPNYVVADFAFVCESTLPPEALTSKTQPLCPDKCALNSVICNPPECYESHCESWNGVCTDNAQLANLTKCIDGDASTAHDRCEDGVCKGFVGNWTDVVWDACTFVSATRTGTVHCESLTGLQLPDIQCAPELKPDTLRACAPYWWESGWTECDYATQTQSVECRAQEDQAVLDETNCGNQKPLSNRACYEGVWESTTWSLCSYEAIRTRIVTCSIVATGDQCDPILEPNAASPCTPFWNISDWTPCNIDTGEIQSRTYACEADEDGSTLNAVLCGQEPENNRTCVDICGYPPNIMDVHVVAMYQSTCDHSYGFHQNTLMNLEISDSISERSSLFLHSYEGISYRILGAGKNKIWKIVAQGYHPQGIIDPPPHAVVKTCGYGSCAPTTYSVATIQNDAISYTSAVGADALGSVTAEYTLPNYIFIGSGTPQYTAANFTPTVCWSTLPAEAVTTQTQPACPDKCVLNGVTCNPPECYESHCETWNGACTDNVQLDDLTSCSDGDANTTHDRCEVGVCKGFSGVWSSVTWSTCWPNATRPGTVECEDATGLQKQDSDCPPELKPLTLSDCVPYWWSSGFGACDHATQTQTVECKAAEDDAVLNDIHCYAPGKPITSQTCYDGTWDTGAWSLCTYDNAARLRTVTCQIVATGDMCDPALEPTAGVSCTPFWNITDWTLCSIDTGEIQTRTFTCVSEEDGNEVNAILCGDEPEASNTCVDICGYPPNIMDVHVVAMYQSTCDHSYGFHQNTLMNLEISDSISERSSLFLHSYEGISYRILGAGKNKIWKIVAQGYHPQGIIDPPPHAVVKTCGYGSCAPTTYSVGTIQNDAISYTSAVGAAALGSVTADYTLPNYIFIGSGTPQYTAANFTPTVCKSTLPAEAVTTQTQPACPDKCVLNGVTCNPPECYESHCETWNGACTDNVQLDDLTSCSDGDANTTQDRCEVGVCKGFSGVWSSVTWSTCWPNATRPGTLKCEDATGLQKQDSDCPPELKPLTLSECVPYWWSSGFGACGHAIQTQTVECRAAEDDALLNDIHCYTPGKPIISQTCYEGTWETGDWSLCTYENTARSRIVTCQIAATGDLCDPTLEPTTGVSCTPFWNITDWTLCSIDTGEIQTRTFTCVSEEDGNEVNAILCGDEPEASNTCVDRCAHPSDIMDVHVVAMYESDCDHGYMFHQNTLMNLEISDSVSERTSLFLNSYEGISYRLLGAGKNKIWKIVVQGYHPQGIIDAPSHTIIKSCGYEGCGPKYYTASEVQNNAASYTSALQTNTLASVTASYTLPIYSFIGSGTAQYSAGDFSPAVCKSALPPEAITTQTPPDCEDKCANTICGSTCQISTCNQTTGLCSTPILVNSGYCDDQSATTIEDRCVNGVCVGYAGRWSSVIWDTCAPNKTLTGTVKCEDAAGVQKQEADCTPDYKPLTISECVPYWWSSEFGACDHGTQTQTVECRAIEDDGLLNEVHCYAGSKPLTNRICDDGTWGDVSWGLCDSGGQQHGTVQCLENGLAVGEENCDLAIRPLITRACPTTEICDNGIDDDGNYLTDCDDSACSNAATCQPRWSVLSWSDCSSLTGNRERNVNCVNKNDVVLNDTECSMFNKNATEQECVGTWDIGSWSGCVGGLQTNLGDCVSTEDEAVLPDANCLPFNTRTCGQSPHLVNLVWRLCDPVTGKRTATAQCIDEHVNHLSIDQCDGNLLSETCPGTWSAAAFGDCVNGEQNQILSCTTSDGVKLSSDLWDTQCVGEKPSEVEKCAAPQLVNLVWRSCDPVTGKRTATAQCIDEHGNPLSVDQCDGNLLSETCPGTWSAAAFGDCVNGERNQILSCTTSDGVQLSSDLWDTQCVGKKPSEVEKCTECDEDLLVHIIAFNGCAIDEPETCEMTVEIHTDCKPKKPLVLVLTSNQDSRWVIKGDAAKIEKLILSGKKKFRVFNEYGTEFDVAEKDKCFQSDGCGQPMFSSYSLTIDNENDFVSNVAENKEMSDHGIGHVAIIDASNADRVVSLENCCDGNEDYEIEILVEDDAPGVRYCTNIWVFIFEVVVLFVWV